MKLRITCPKQPEPFAIRIWNGACPPLSLRPPIVKIHKAATPDEFEGVSRWHARVPVEVDAKKLKVIKGDDEQVLDYRGVRIKGYLSTFGNTDREGDRVRPGAFAETLKHFMATNPVLLTDHRNSVVNLAGYFESMKEDKQGLAFEAVLSDAPGNIDVRFKVAEGSLCSTSMGGIFYREDEGDRSLITRVSLFEGSLVPIPANPKAVFSVRALDESDKKYLRHAARFASYYDFLEAERNHAELPRAS